MINENNRIIPTNRKAVISLVAAILTLLSFCTAVAPIPFSGFVCYPAAALLGIVALAAGLSSLRQIHSSKESGRALALIGAWIGGLTLLATFCAITLGILLLPEFANFIRQVLK